MELAMRKDVPEELTWDLSLIYKTEEDMYRDFEKMKTLAKELADNYKGKLTTAERILECLKKYGEFMILADHVGTYTGLAVEVDYYDTYNQERCNKVETVMAALAADLSFIDNEILEVPERILKEAIEKADGQAHYLKNLLRQKPYQLSKESEKLLASLSQILNAPSTIYNMAKLADMRFDSFTVDGKEYPLGYSLFEDNYEYEKNTQVRREAFRVFSEKIRQYENVTAAAYNANVQRDKIIASQRGYDSVFDYLLFDQQVTREMYDRQIDLITEGLAPAMRKYAGLIKRIHKLDKMTFADLKLPIDPDFDPGVTVEQAREYVKNGLSVMGEDYQAMVEEAFKKRWIDFARNQGKSTGGFCASPYRKGSFILLSWNDRMADVFTIAHELGHAGHFKLAGENQSVFDNDVSTYFVEAPSTMNEVLLAHYLLKTNPDKRFRRWVLSCMIGNTYYHNFVTHLREAWYQREVYKIIDEGGSVTADVLSDLFKKNLELFWGDSVELIPGAELTWMRQPHYYMGLYSYTYSAGLTVATEAARKIEEEGDAAVEAWKNVLKAGSTKDPVGLAAIAGIDITTDEPLKRTIQAISEMVDEIERLTNELENEG